MSSNCIHILPFRYFLHIMYYLVTKEVIKMAFGAAGVGGACGPNFLPGIAVVVVIILLLIAMGIVF
jgi:hypothetical protein